MLDVFGQWWRSYAGMVGNPTTASSSGYGASLRRGRAMRKGMKDFAERTRATAKYDKGARDMVMFADDEDLIDYMKLDYLVHGLTSEAGEVAGAMKKYVRGDYNHDELVRRVRKESADVLWYIGRIFDDLGLDMDLEAEMLLAHLLDRDAKGVIKGDGDER